MLLGRLLFDNGAIYIREVCQQIHKMLRERMIKYLYGDLLDANATFILHSVNNRGKFNSGVAKAIRQRYPKAYERYMEVFRSDELELGTIHYVNIGDKTIINGVGQADYGYDGKQYVNYHAIQDVMEAVADLADGREVAMPTIGAGLGGGSWDRLAGIIELAGINATVYLLPNSKLPATVEKYFRDNNLPLPDNLL